MKLWIARDFNGDLNLYACKPVLDYYTGLYNDGDIGDQYLSINKNLFQEVTFENSPQMVEFKLVKEE